MRPDTNKTDQHFQWLPVQFDQLNDFLLTKAGWSPDDLQAHTFGAMDSWNEFLKSNLSDQP